MSESSTFENRMAAYQDRQSAYADKVLNFEERTQQFKDQVIAEGKQIATEATAPLIAKITEVGIQKLREGKKAVETVVKKASTAVDETTEAVASAGEEVGDQSGGFLRGARSLINRSSTEASETMQELRGRLRAAASNARDFAREKLSRPNRVREQNRPDPAQEEDDDDDDFEDAVEDPETDIPDPEADFEQVSAGDVPDQSAIDDDVGDIADYFRQIRESQAAESAAEEPSAFDAFTTRLQTQRSSVDPRFRGNFGELEDPEGDDDFSPLSQTIGNAPEVRNAVSVTQQGYEPADDALQQGVRSLQQRLGGNSAEEEGMEMNSLLGSEQQPIQMEELGEIQPAEADADLTEGARVESEQSANVAEVETETGSSEADAESAIAEGSTATEQGRFIGGEGQETFDQATEASEGLDTAGGLEAGGEVAGGELAGEETAELAASALPGVGEVVVGLVAIGSLLGGIFGSNKPEAPPPPVKLAQMSAPRFQAGLRSD